MPLLDDPIDAGERPGDNLYVIPVGGLGEIGKNMLILRCRDDILVIDAGLAFPDEEMFGVDLVIPDITYLVENKHMLRGIILTHGHEDHIGALPYLLRSVGERLYGTRLTLGLAKVRLGEFALERAPEYHEVRPRDRVKFGCFEVEFFRVNHSTADCVGVIVHTPAGVVVHTGDFKFDQTPVDGQVSDYRRLAELGDEGVLLLLSDSTNAERQGYTPSEKVVGETFDGIFAKATGRILVTSFASNVPRIQQVFDAAYYHDRKVAVVGRSMENVVRIAMELGYLKVPGGTMVEDLDHLLRLPDERVVILMTGSQGEPMSALSRIASGEHSRLDVKRGDVVIIAASPVPGNEKLVSRTVDNLFRRGATVIYREESGVHVSGHASQEELKLMLNLTRPKFFVPIHGEYRHLVSHAKLAERLGIPRSHVFVVENGTILEFTRGSGRKAGQVPAGKVLVDGLGVGDVGTIVLRDRRMLAQDGMVVVVASVHAEQQAIVSGPDVVSRGFVYVKEAETLLEEAREKVKEIVETHLEEAVVDWNTVKASIREGLGSFFYERTGRRPMILPIIMEI